MSKVFRSPTFRYVVRLSSLVSNLSKKNYKASCQEVAEVRPVHICVWILLCIVERILLHVSLSSRSAHCPLLTSLDNARNICSSSINARFTHTHLFLLQICEAHGADAHICLVKYLLRHVSIADGKTGKEQLHQVRFHFNVLFLCFFLFAPLFFSLSFSCSLT